MLVSNDITISTVKCNCYSNFQLTPERGTHNFILAVFDSLPAAAAQRVSNWTSEIIPESHRDSYNIDSVGLGYKSRWLRLPAVTYSMAGDHTPLSPLRRGSVVWHVRRGVRATKPLCGAARPARHHGSKIQTSAHIRVG